MCTIMTTRFVPFLTQHKRIYGLAHEVNFTVWIEQIEERDPVEVQRSKKAKRR